MGPAFLNRLLRLRQALTATRLLSLLSVLIGVAAGIAAFLYVKLVVLVHRWVDVLSSAENPLLKSVLFVMAPALGGLAAGWLIHRFAPERRGTATARKATPNLINSLHPSEMSSNQQMLLNQFWLNKRPLPTGVIEDQSGGRSAISEGISILSKIGTIVQQPRSTPYLIVQSSARH